MDRPYLLNSLVDRSVLDTDSKGSLYITESFRTSVTDRETELYSLTDDEILDQVTAVTGNEEAASVVCENSDYDPEFLARYVAISEQNIDLATGQTAMLAVIVKYLENGMPRSDGVPSMFFPFDGGDLQLLVSLYDRCIVYAWREECPSCELLCEDFEDVFDTKSSPDLPLLAVYGPDCPALLQTEYNVVGAPTTLFMTNGTVDTRLVGSPAREKLETEIATLKRRTVTSV